MKLVIDGYIVWKKWSWDSEGSFHFQAYAVPGGHHADENSETILVAPYRLETEVPDDFNPVPFQVKALEEAKRQARLTLANELAKLDDRIAKLLCIAAPVGDPVEPPREVPIDTSSATDVTPRAVPLDDDDYPF